MKNLVTKIFILALILFGASQLVINSILSPLGIQLQALNSEKEYLLEENRSMEEKIAKTDSIKVITTLTEENLNLTSENTPTVIYIPDESIFAER